MIGDVVHFGVPLCRSIPTIAEMDYLYLVRRAETADPSLMTDAQVQALAADMDKLTPGACLLPPTAVRSSLVDCCDRIFDQYYSRDKNRKHYLPAPHRGPTSPTSIIAYLACVAIAYFATTSVYVIIAVFCARETGARGCDQERGLLREAGLGECSP